MTNVRTVTMVLPLVCLTAANVSAQVRIGVTAGVRKSGLRTFLLAGPALTFPNERRPDFGLAAGAESEYAMDEDLGFTLGTVYTYGTRNLATYTGGGEYVRLRNVVIRSGLVSRFR